MADYKFCVVVVVEPVRMQRIEREKQAESQFDCHHHTDPFRRMFDAMRIEANVSAPKGMTPQQTQAFERAMNRTLRHFRHYIAEEFDAISCEETRS